MSKTYVAVKRLLHSIYGKLTSPAILEEQQYFPQAITFRNHWQQLRDEALVVATRINQIPRFHEIMAEQASISANDNKDWRMYILRAYGVDVEDHQKQCPALTSLISGNPNILSATFSFMAPGKVVPTHTGPFRGITRYFLALDIPEDEQGKPLAHITIDNETFYLHSGDDLLWDDTYPHSVNNDSSRYRTVLLMDVLRTDLPKDLYILTKIIIKLTAFSIRAKKIFK